MNEMLRSLGFGQVTNTKWTNGSAMTILIDTTCLNLRCYGDITNLITIDYFIESTDLETMKRYVEKFMLMVGKCIQVDDE